MAAADSAVDTTLVLPDEIIDHILVGRSSATGRPHLPVCFRWMAARVCSRWRRIVRAAPVPHGAHTWHGCPAKGIVRGRVLCLSGCKEIGARGRLDEVDHALLREMRRLLVPLRQRPERPHLSEGEWERLGQCLPCSLCRRNRRASCALERTACVMARLAARIHDAAAFGVFYGRLAPDHGRHVLHECIRSDCAPACRIVLDACTTTTAGDARDLWDTVGIHGARNVARLLLAREKENGGDVWNRGRAASRWVAKAAVGGRTAMVGIARDTGDLNVLLKAALVDGRTSVCRAIVAAEPTIVDRLDDIVYDCVARNHWPGCFPSVDWLLRVDGFRPLRANLSSAILWRVRFDPTAVAAADALLERMKERWDMGVSS
jgi:hypothetical protein